MKKIRKLNNIGVEYEFDLSLANKDQILEFGKNLSKDNVVLLRNQSLNEREILNVCETIGTVLKFKRFFIHPKYPGLYRVTNRRENNKKIGIFADKELDWHSNGNGRPSGKECCVMLYCIEPGLNSVTSFCDTRQAYIDLPDDIKELCDNVDAVFQFKNNTFYDLDSDDMELELFNTKNIFPDGIIKPLVYTHPFDGNKGLYFTFHYIQDWWDRRDKSKDISWLKDYLMNHVFNNKYIYHHSDWKKGDMIFMDQFHSIHKRNAVEGDRFLYRVTLDYSNAII